MQMMRWQPLSSLWNEMGREVGRLQNQMNRVFETFGLERGNWPALAMSYPAVNLWQDNESVFAEMELPGVTLDDLEISIMGGNQLTIKGERRRIEVPEGAVWHRQERAFGSFSRTIELPNDVNADKVEATFCLGVLTIKMPKSEMARTRKIAVKTAGIAQSATVKTQATPPNDIVIASPQTKFVGETTTEGFEPTTSTQSSGKES